MTKVLTDCLKHRTVFYSPAAIDFTYDIQQTAKCGVFRDGALIVHHMRISMPFLLFNWNALFCFFFFIVLWLTNPITWTTSLRVYVGVHEEFTMRQLIRYVFIWTCCLLKDFQPTVFVPGFFCMKL